MQIGTLDIDVSEKVKDFVQYLDSTDRIILSARFGDGKTHLLNALRNDETANKEYEFFTIYPVNYSVAPNEDVFEYIKRDIIVQLNNQGLLNNIDLEAIFGSFIDFETSHLLYRSFYLLFLGELSIINSSTNFARSRNVISRKSIPQTSICLHSQSKRAVSTKKMDIQS